MNTKNRYFIENFFFSCLDSLIFVNFLSIFDSIRRSRWWSHSSRRGERGNKRENIMKCSLILTVKIIECRKLEILGSSGRVLASSNWCCFCVFCEPIKNGSTTLAEFSTFNWIVKFLMSTLMNRFDDIKFDNFTRRVINAVDINSRLRFSMRCRRMGKAWTVWQSVDNWKASRTLWNDLIVCGLAAAASQHNKKRYTSFQFQLSRETIWQLKFFALQNEMLHYRAPHSNMWTLWTEHRARTIVINYQNEKFPMKCKKKYYFSKSS